MKIEKIIKNTTNNDIELDSVGLIIPSNGSYVVETSEVLMWATEDAIDELTPYINSGDVIINNGSIDLNSTEALRFLEYAERITIQQDDVDVVKINKVLNFEGDNIQVVNEGNGKTTVKISDDTSDTLYLAKCIVVDDCVVTTDLEPLLDHTCSLIKQENC